MSFPGEDSYSHFQNSLVACSILCRFEDTWTKHICMEQRLMKTRGCKFEKGKGGVYEGVLREGEKGRGNDMIVVSINTCDYL